MLRDYMLRDYTIEFHDPGAPRRQNGKWPTYTVRVRATNRGNALAFVREMLRASRELNHRPADLERWRFN